LRPVNQKVPAEPGHRNNMKQLIAVFILAVAFASCAKKTECIGLDCTFPEAVVSIDSISDKVIYTTLLNSDGRPFVCPLTLAPEIDVNDFIRFTGFQSTNYTENHSESANGRIVKVYYVSTNQSYVEENADYINALQTTLEIAAYSDTLRLTY